MKSWCAILSNCQLNTCGGETYMSYSFKTVFLIVKGKKHDILRSQNVFILRESLSISMHYFIYLIHEEDNFCLSHSKL